MVVPVRPPLCHGNSNTSYRSCSANKHGENPASAAPTDIDQLHQRITSLEQKNVHLARQLEERDLELDAARAANR
jgi:hypothetical protein